MGWLLGWGPLYWETKLSVGQRGIDWRKVFLIPRISTIESYTRSFQYKIINNALFLNKRLFKFGVIKSPACSFCGRLMSHHYIFSVSAV